MLTQWNGGVTVCGGWANVAGHQRFHRSMRDNEVVRVEENVSVGMRVEMKLCVGAENDKGKWQEESTGIDGGNNGVGLVPRVCSVRCTDARLIWRRASTWPC